MAVESARTAASPAVERGLFFTSIPKAGKNLVYSFLNGLRVARAPVERDPALWYAERPWLRSHRRTLTYALPAPEAGMAAELPERFARFSAEITALDRRTVLHHHFPFCAELAGTLAAARVPALFLRRDPRDVLVSMADYLLVQHKPVHLANRYSGLERPALIVRLWEGDELLLPFPAYCAAFTPWLDTGHVLALRFEDIIGLAGGGDALRQRTQLRALADRIGPVSETDFDQACARTYNPRAGTFFRGQIGRWHEEANPLVSGIVHSAEAGRLAASWGYPP
jgi:hypothetical protein